MTTMNYKLADGTIVNTLTEAKASGQAYKTIFHEDPYGELHPTKEDPKWTELRAKRIAKLTEHWDKTEG